MDGSTRSTPTSTQSQRPPGVLTLLAIGAVAWLGACSPDAETVTALPADLDAVETQEAPEFITEPTRVIESSVLELVRRRDDLDGAYVFRLVADDAPEIGRDNIIVGRDPNAPGDEGIYVRRVLRSERDGDQITFETVQAYWHEVVRGGTYSTTAPIESDGPVRGSNITLTGSAPLPSKNVPLDDRDLCALTDSLFDAVPGNIAPTLCNEERDFSFGIGIVKVTIDGTITEIFIDEGSIEITGTMELATTINEGGFVGGTAPTFYPCNIRAYSGCLTTPTGAAFYEFMQRWAPQLPDNPLRPVRVCIPGTWVTTRKGYWNKSVFPWRWVSAVRVRCTVSGGQLPTIELPSLVNLSINPTPRIKGRMIMDVKGTGGLNLKVTPSTGATAGASFGSKLSLIGTIGFFLSLDIDLKNAGARVGVDFDEELAVTTQWTASGGWNGGVELLNTDIGGSIDLFGPDSAQVRAGITAEITGEACAALLGKCELEEGEEEPSVELKLGAQAEATLFRFLEGVWSRTPNDNTKLDTDASYEFKIGAGLELPLVGWLAPDVPLEWDPDEIDFLRFDMSDRYSTGRIEVSTTTTGSSLDSNGYEVVVERADTFPVLIPADAERKGPAFDHGLPLRFDVGVNDSRMPFPLAPPVCQILYSDNLLASAPPVLQVAMALARRLGAGPPNYALASPCMLLIADHRVTLTGVADNCTVVGGASRVVALEQINILDGRPTNLTRVPFEITCVDPPAPLGTVDVTTNSGGFDLDATGYTVLVNGSPAGTVETSGTKALQGLTPGDRSILLDDVADNCTVVSANPVTVTVPSGGSAPVSFDVACDAVPVPLGSVRVEAPASGSMVDADGFGIRLDGLVRAQLDDLTRSVNLDGLMAGDTAVIHVDDLADNCRLDAPSPRWVALDPVDMTDELSFPITCTDAPIESAEGEVFVSSIPTPTAMVRLSDGSALRLTGLLAAELQQLNGLRVTVNGVRNGGSLDVYGYRIEASASDETRVGILVHRDGEYWLFGAGAVRIDRAPARLLEQVGRLVWITGRASAGVVVPELFGILREGR